MNIDTLPDDNHLARDVVRALKSALPYSSQFNQIMVQNGWVTLHGNLEWQYQLERAESAVRRTRGVVGVTNSVHLRPRITSREIKQRVAEAARRSAEMDGATIAVDARSGLVGVHGTVRSWALRDDLL